MWVFKIFGVKIKIFIPCILLYIIEAKRNDGFTIAIKRDQ